MELNKFIEETLKQTVEGVSKAEESISLHGATINPIGMRFIQNGNSNQYDHAMPQEVAFHVGLTSTSNKDSTEGVGVFLGSINMGKKNNSGAEEAAITSVKFTVPLVLSEGKNFKDKNRTKISDIL